MSECNTDTEPMLGNATFEALQEYLQPDGGQGLDLLSWQNFSDIGDEDDTRQDDMKMQPVEDPLSVDATSGGQLPRRVSSDLTALCPMSVEQTVPADAPPSAGLQRCDSSSEQPPDAIPPQDSWPGQLNFQVTVRSAVADSGRQPPYVFSTHSGKLYTDIDVAVPFSFSLQATAGAGTDGLRIRALPVYRDAHHAHTPVRRCPQHREPNHSSNQGQTELLHVVRAEHPKAKYRVSEERRAVTVPFEQPGPGLDDYTVLYRFMCMNTCMGGINRRRLAIVFTLENRSSGAVLGRQSLEVKVCKCPHRDWRTDERKRTSGAGLTDAKRRRTLPSTGTYTVQADSWEEYEYLLDQREAFRRLQQRRAAAAADTNASTGVAPAAPTVPLTRQATTPVKAELFYGGGV